MNRRIQIALVVIFISFQAWGQKQAANWYFGSNAGIRFNTTSTVSVNNGALLSTEGAASVSSADGQLLFYTNGVTVWNKNHKVMDNGIGLAGNTNTTQSAIIIPRPKSKNLYYIFTLDNLGIGNGLNYSEVDISANGGLGKVTSTKNVSIRTSVAEKLTAIPHANGKDYWILVHGVDDKKFYAYQITENGVPKTAVISTTGSFHPNILGTMGYMKFSPDGEKVACAVSGSNFVELLDFDNTTGELTNPMRLDFTSSPYGIEFSPNGKLLYVSAGSSIFQYKIPQIINSGLLALSEREIKSDAAVWALQLGLDKKIYVCKQSDKIGVIANPNDGNGNEDFEDNSFTLSNTAVQGLPNQPQNYFNENLIVVDNACLGQEASFRVLLNEPDSIQWNFGDNNRFSALRPKHIYSAKGNYFVTARVFTNGYSEDISRQITVEDLPSFSLGADTTLCKGQYLNFNFSIPNAAYLWNNGKTSSVRKITTPGVHHLAVTAKGCTLKDSVVVDYNIINVQFSANDFEQCFEGNNFEFKSTTGEVKTASWYVDNAYLGDGKNTSTSFNTDGIKKIKHVVTSEYGCTDSVIKEIKVNKTPKANFGVNAKNTCGSANSFTFINTTNYPDDYSFEFQIEGNTIKNKNSVTWNFSKEGEHDVVLVVKTAEGCEDILEKKITVFPAPDASFDIIANSNCLADNNFTVSFTGKLRTFETLTWEIDGTPYTSPNNTFTKSFITTGKHTVSAKISNTSGCFEVNAKEVEVYENPVADFSTTSNTLACLGTKNIEFSNLSTGNLLLTSYDWNFGDNTQSDKANPIKSYTSQSQFQVSLTAINEAGCTNTITKNINTYEMPELGIDVAVTNACENNNSFTLTLDNGNANANISKITWQNNGGVSIPTQSPAMVNFPAKGEYTITVEAETIFGCKDDATTTVKVFPAPSGELTVNTVEQCLAGNAFEVTAPTNHDNGIDITKYAWDLQTNSSSIANNKATFNYDAIGNYEISAEIIDENGCKATLQKTVSVHPQPEFKINPKSGCVNTAIALSAEDVSPFIVIDSWNWDFGNSTTSTMANPSATYKRAGTFSIEATAETDKGCTYTYKLDNGVTIHPNPVVEFEYKRVSWNFEETIIEFEGNSSIATNNYTWDFGNGKSGSTPYKRVDYSEAGYYTVTLSSKTDKGCVGSITKSILIVPPFDAYVPTSFTPNGDGINDYFGMEGVEFISAFDMRIFNRWGQEVFHSSNLKNQWNGKYGNTALSPGLYTYTINISDAEGRPYEINGSIQLIR